MNYIALYRKWRPQNFDEVVGQEHIVQTLKNAIKHNRLAHAYLFSGPRGTGKTSIARILAKALNCETGPTVNICGKCDRCLKIKNGMAVEVIEIDAASNRGIDEIRDLREKVRYAPVEGAYKVYIIDEVHMLTPEAFNALLKTIEEPPPQTVFILATTEASRVPQTIASRCQRFDFKRMSVKMVEDNLLKISNQEGFKIDAEALNLIAKTAEGSMRDALSLFDQLISFCAQKVTLKDVRLLLGAAEPGLLFDFSQNLKNSNLPALVTLVDKTLAEGASIPQLLKDLINHFRHLMLCKMGSSNLVELADENLARLETVSQNFKLLDLQRILKVLSRAETDLKWHPNARLLLEMALIEIGENFSPLTEPFPVATAAKPEDNLEKIIRSWPQILDYVKNRSLFGFVSLQEAKPAEAEGNQLMIKFKKGFSFYQKRLEEPANLAALEEALEKIIGLKYKISLVTDTDSLANPVSKSISADEVIEVFEGRVVS